MQEEQSLGSFGQGTGSTDAIQQAISARQGQGSPVPALDQTLQGSPVSSPIPPAPLTGITPQGQAETKPQVSNPEVEIILKALSQRLSTISKIENPPTPSLGGGGTYGKR